MAKTARSLKGHLEADVDKSLAGNGWGILFVAFLAVAREGIETALFIWAAATATGEKLLPTIGAILGLGIAALLGWLIFKGMVRLNLKKFFTWSGAFLIIVAAGVLSYGIHEWQEAGLIPGDANKAFNVSEAVPSDSWYGVILRGTIGFTPEMSWIQVIGWVLYVAITLSVFLVRMKEKTPTT
jgi:high-affinity iron transporter